MFVIYRIVFGVFLFIMPLDSLGSPMSQVVDDLIRDIRAGFAAQANPELPRATGT